MLSLWGKKILGPPFSAPLGSVVLWSGGAGKFKSPCTPSPEQGRLWSVASALAPALPPALQVPVAAGLKILVLDQDEPGGPHVCLELTLVLLGLYTPPKPG